MKNKKKIAIIAKYLFKNSFTGNFLDDAKIMQNIKILTSQKPHGLVNILRFYKRLLAQTLAAEVLQIETTEKLSAVQEKELMAKTNARKIIYNLNPKMVFGAKIKHGDWIYDSSLQAKLSQIAKS